MSILVSPELTCNNIQIKYVDCLTYPSLDNVLAVGASTGDFLIDIIDYDL